MAQGEFWHVTGDASQTQYDSSYWLTEAVLFVMLLLMNYNHIVNVNGVAISSTAERYRTICEVAYLTRKLAS